MNKDISIILCMILSLLSCANSPTQFPSFSMDPDQQEFDIKLNDYVNQVNENLATYNRIDLKIESTYKTDYGFVNELNPVSIWYDSTVPIKISKTVYNEENESSEFEYYFDESKLVYGDEIHAKYIFKNEQLTYWLDQDFKLNEISEIRMKEKSNRIIESVNLIFKTKSTLHNNGYKTNASDSVNLKQNATKNRKK